MEVHKAGCNVAMFQRRDVPTARRPHAVTSQRRDVGSTNIEVNKRQRREVSSSHVNSISASPSLKAKSGPEFKDRKSYKRGHGN